MGWSNDGGRVIEGNVAKRVVQGLVGGTAFQTALTGGAGE